MLFSSISVINGRLFLRCSIVWRQICWSDHWTIFEELTSENKFIFALRKRWRVHLFQVLDLLIKCPVTKLQTNQNVHQVLLYVNSTEKWTGMKNTGLKMREEDKVGFSYYWKAKIVGKSFSILCLKCWWVNMRVDTCKKLEETMHVHVRLLSPDSTFDLF